jgi:hypothetical protein
MYPYMNGNLLLRKLESRTSLVDFGKKEMMEREES